MIETESLEVRNDTDYYISYELPNHCVLFAAKRTVTYVDANDERVVREASHAECASMLTSTFSCAMIAGKTMIQKGDCKEFCLQTVECVKDEEDTGMIILMTK